MSKDKFNVKLIFKKEDVRGKAVLFRVCIFTSSIVFKHPVALIRVYHLFHIYFLLKGNLFSTHPASSVRALHTQTNSQHKCSGNLEEPTAKDNKTDNATYMMMIINILTNWTNIHAAK
jgi:hypothetical protein